MMPAEANSPSEFPPLKAMTEEVLDCWAIEFAEHNSLREQCGLPPRTSRTYSREERFKGRLMHPTAMLVNDSDVIATIRE